MSVKCVAAGVGVGVGRGRVCWAWAWAWVLGVGVGGVCYFFVVVFDVVTGYFIR